MYSRQEASRLRQEFWTALGQYLQPILSSEGEKVTWLNYKTGEKGIRFRMDADAQRAAIAIELDDPDPGMQALYFEQFREWQRLLEDETGETWTWQLHTSDDTGRIVSRISTELQDVNLFRREDWPALISFFKPRILALDRFWNGIKYGFEALRS